MYFFGFWCSFFTVILKIFINTFFIGGYSAFIFTALGSLSSFIIMWIVKSILKSKVTCIGVSVMGSFFHIVTQYTVSFFVMKTAVVFYMMPYAVILSLISSLIVGMLCNIIINLKGTVKK